MSFKFGKKSLERLAECHPDLQRIAHELIKEMDVAILCGFRDKEKQNQAFINGKSKLQWPRSKHNRVPSEAMDLAPYDPSMPDKVHWTGPKMHEMLDKIEEIAKRLGIKIRLGRTFSFKDYPHVELHDKAKK